jgi:hypothetical protein
VRHWFVALLGACFLSTAQAQLSGVVGAAMVPSPLGIVLTVGKWVYDAATKKQVYYIEVAGQGTDPTQARDNGFRLAVEQALGTLISSETEVQNGRIVRDEIVSYAAGFVDRFEIVETRTATAGTLVFMRVWVKRSDLSDRLLNRSERSGEVDGARASVQLQTLNQERATGDRLLQQVLNDFPKRAFDIDLKPADIVRQNRSAQMEVNFVVRWNQDYLRSLWTALEATAYRGATPVSTVGVNSGSWFGGFGGQARFDDTQKYQAVVRSLVGTVPAVMVTVRGTNRDVIHRACYYYQELDHQARYSVTTERFVELSPYAPTAYVNGAYKMKSRVQIPINGAVLNQISAIDMTIVTQQQCPNR